MIITANFYFNSPSQIASFVVKPFPQGGKWIIPNNILSNWNNAPRNYMVTDVGTLQKMNIFNGKQAYFFFNATGRLVRYITSFGFLIKFPPNVNDDNSDTNTSGLWYYNIIVTWFGKDGVRSSAIYPSVFRTKITDSNSTIVDSKVFIINTNKRIKDIIFSYTLEEGQPK